MRKATDWASTYVRTHLTLRGLRARPRPLAGRLVRWLSAWSKAPKVPEVPTVPKVPSVPKVLPKVPKVPSVPKVPKVP